VTIGFPDWWEVGRGGYPNIQKLTRTVFDGLLTNVKLLSWFPDPDVYEQHLAAGGGYLRTYRTGGQINLSQNRDEPKVQFAALTRSSDDSWELIEFVRQVLEEGYGRAAAIVPGTTYELKSAGEVVGPQLIPDLIGDDRLVPITYQFYVPRPKGLPNYRQILGL
jgi:hypothetical protein